MKESTVESLILMFIIVSLCGVFVMAGYSLSERNQCIKLGGNYSLDFGKCYKKGELDEQVR